MEPKDLFQPELALVFRMLAPDRVEAIIKYAEARRQHDARRASALADGAEAHSGEGFPDLLRRAHEDERKDDLGAQVFRIALKTESETKMRALGRALAEGLLANDDAAVDETSLLLRALEDLEAAHIRVLDRLCREGTRYKGVPDYDLATMFPNGVTCSTAS